MSELLVVQRSKELLAIACAGIMLTGCTSVEADKPAPKTANTVQTPASPYLERCFDEPLAPRTLEEPDPDAYATDEAYRKANEQYDDRNDALTVSPKITLRYTADGKLRQAESITPQNEQKLIDANVMITRPYAPDPNKYIKGSATVMKGKQGEQLLLTNAHVAGETIADITVEDSKGNTTGIIDGCLIYEGGGEKMQLKAEPGSNNADYDLAILRPASPLDATSLQLAPKTPARGTWVHMVNSQGQHSPDDPASYQAVVATRLPSRSRNTVVTGIAPNGSKDKFDYTGGAGASGGIIGTVQAEIAGIGMASDGGNTELLLKSSYGMAVDKSAPTEKLAPTGIVFVDAETIRHALDQSTRY